MKFYESGAALAEDMGVPVSKMQDSVEAHYQASLKTTEDTDGGPYPAHPLNVVEKCAPDANIGVVGSGKAKKAKGAAKSALLVATDKRDAVANLEAWRDWSIEAFDDTPGVLLVNVRSYVNAGYYLILSIICEICAAILCWERQRGEVYRAHKGDEQLRRDQQLLHEQLLEQNRDLREAHEKSLTEMEELKKFQSSTFDTIARRRLVEDQDTILGLTGKMQDLQNEINCMNDSRDSQDAESVRSGNSHVTSRPVSFPPHPIPEGMLSRSYGVPSRREGPPSIWDTHGKW